MKHDELVQLCFDAGVEIMPRLEALEEAVEHARTRSVDGFDRVLYVDLRGASSR